MVNRTVSTYSSYYSLMHHTYMLLTGENRLLLDSITEWNQQQLVFKGILYQQNHVDQNFAMTQQFTTFPSALTDDWVYFSCLLSVGCTNKSAQIIPAVGLPSYISIHSNGDRAVSVTASKIIITIWPPSWRFGWGVAMVTWKEISAMGFGEKTLLMSESEIRPYPLFFSSLSPDFLSCQADERWLAEHRLPTKEATRSGRALRRESSQAAGQQQLSDGSAAPDLSNVINLSWTRFPQVPGNVGGKGAQLALFCFALKSIKTWWHKLASAAQSCRVLPAHCSKIVRHITFRHLRAFFPAELVPPALPPVPLRFPLRDEVSSHCFKVSFYSYGWISVGHEQRAGISYSSHPFAFRWYRNFHRDAWAQKQLIWEEAQKKQLTMPKETSRKHSIHNTATVSLFYIKKTIKFWK